MFSMVQSKDTQLRSMTGLLRGVDAAVHGCRSCSSVAMCSGPLPNVSCMCI